MALSSKHVDDVDTLRALAHPLRIKLLGRLRAHGPATASELGRDLDESSGSTSYHLRQLERFGFVVEDEEQPSKRERRWRAAHDVTSWRSADFADSEAGRAADEFIRRNQLQIMLDRLEHWSSIQHEWDPEWLDAAEHSDAILFVRPADLTALSAELWEVVARYAENARPADDPAAAHVSLHWLAIPSEGFPE
ncbi:ArsR family transcriptional regulator [Haloactinopolyspora alba]|uniref:ArsR family transcriptional regulator n=1 Tax=Haloactinopolyspora alba TaxID=648780 RepID=A0A2P8E7L3_9ACTN|nr:helix-turn-helix domain-containing protein [Haloactinopolyspora alba]PSL05449.1 ArsR family transcriptional regulator [Haloactinopolyspora alba]